MRVSVRQNLILAAAMIVACIVMWIASLGLKPESALFPRLLLVIILGCALVIAGEQVVRLRRAGREPDARLDQVPAEVGGRVSEFEGETMASGEGAGGRSHAGQWVIAVALVLYVLGFVYVGPYTATFLLLAGLYALLSQVRSWKTVLAGGLLALVITAVLYGLFSIGLNVSMPEAILM